MKNVDFSEVIDFLEGPGVRNWQFTDSGIKLINIRNLVNDKINLENTTNHLSEEEVSKKYNHFLLKEGDYIMASSGVTWGKIAEVKKEHLPLCLNTSIIKLRPKYDDFEKKYLWYFIKSNIFTKQIDKIITGSAQPNFGPSHLKKVKIPLPPLPQQQKIANILDAVDALRQNDKAMIAKYDELTQSLFLDMFGDPVSNPKGWEMVELKSLCSFKKKSIKPDDIVQGENYVALDSIEKVTGKITTLYNVDKGELKSNKFWFDNSYILYGKLRPYLNKVALPYFEGVCSTDIIPIQPIKNMSNRFFISSILRHSSFVAFADERSSGANLPRISPSEVEKYLTIKPPFKLQNQFAECVAAIEAQKAVAQASLAKSEELFNSLLQKAFKGELV
jgi:type I restriction enzyme S subunit